MALNLLNVSARLFLTFCVLVAAVLGAWSVWRVVLGRRGLTPRKSTPLNKALKLNELREMKITLQLSSGGWREQAEATGRHRHRHTQHRAGYNGTLATTTAAVATRFNLLLLFSFSSASFSHSPLLTTFNQDCGSIQMVRNKHSLAASAC